jgi:aldehyde dehydrogenase (NAD+)
VNLVHGLGEEAGAALVEHPGVRLISFTGSVSVGRLIASRCGALGKNVSLELGGKNAQLVMDDADLELALEGALWGAFGTTGQRCTATSRLLLHEAIEKEFTTRLLERAKALRIGNGLDEQTQMGPLFCEAARTKVTDYVAIGKKEGAKLLLGGENLSDGDLQHGWFFKPTVFSACRQGMRLTTEEIFGPLVAIVPIRNLDEGVKFLNDTQYGLSASIYTRDVNQAFRAIRDIECGIVYVNGPTIGAEVQLPFGGVKSTGNGHREAGHQVLDTYSEWKSVYVDYSGKLQKAQIDS